MTYKWTCIIRWLFAITIGLVVLVILFLVLVDLFVPKFWMMDIASVRADCDLDQYNAIEKCDVRFEQ